MKNSDKSIRKPQSYLIKIKVELQHFNSQKFQTKKKKIMLNWGTVYLTCGGEWKSAHISKKYNL